MAKPRDPHDAMGDYAMGFPGATEAFPWGERVVKVAKKVFVFLGRRETGGFGISVKLPISGRAALSLPFVEPTGYGLGKSGWVTAQFAKGEPVPSDLFREWIDESYRAIAPKKMIALLDARNVAPTAPKKTVARAPKRKVALEKASKNDPKKTPKRR